ncbi:hypothetical protein ACE1BU_23655, partial [Aeromonas veronii]|uniref:hypothetical protein n=1 Tax=Aeromonas veronii TaxID=654 RepID=UPI0035B7B7A0
MAAQEEQQLLQVLFIEGKPHLPVGGGQHPLGIAAGPVTQQAQCRGGQLVITTADRVAQYPLRRAVQAGGGGVEAQIVAQGGQ